MNKRDVNDTNKAMSEVIEVMRAALAAVREKKKQITVELISESDINEYDSLVFELEHIISA